MNYPYPEGIGVFGLGIFYKQNNMEFYVTTQISSMCYFCNNYFGDFKCKAFSVEIPKEIMIGLFDHTKRFDGDKGIGFVLKKNLHGANDIENLIEIYSSIYPSLIRVLNQILKSYGKRTPIS